ncbi:hypothetical protein SHAb15599_00021 [Acinetobacter phage SH-Ab 15599]|nr:hypothetical protein SHAb15599_00021 [Acinetobacter phage SH-Ab 15599]
MSQIFLEAFNSQPYDTEKVEKNGLMDIVYTFQDESNNEFRYHFEKRVNYGRNVFVCTLGQKTPNLKTYKRIFSNFKNPMRVIATLINIVKDVHATRKDVKGIIFEMPTQAFGAHGKLVDKILARELRSVITVEDMNFSIEEFEKMQLQGTVTTVKPNRMQDVYTGKIMNDIFAQRSAGTATTPAKQPVEMKNINLSTFKAAAPHVPQAAEQNASTAPKVEAGNLSGQTFKISAYDRVEGARMEIDFAKDDSVTIGGIKRPMSNYLTSVVDKVFGSQPVDTIKKVVNKLVVDLHLGTVEIADQLVNLKKVLEKEGAKVSLETPFPAAETSPEPFPGSQTTDGVKFNFSYETHVLTMPSVKGYDIGLVLNQLLGAFSESFEKMSNNAYKMVKEEFPIENFLGLLAKVSFNKLIATRISPNWRKIVDEAENVYSLSTTFYTLVDPDSEKFLDDYGILVTFKKDDAGVYRFMNLQSKSKLTEAAIKKVQSAGASVVDQGISVAITEDCNLENSKVIVEFIKASDDAYTFASQRAIDYKFNGYKATYKPKYAEVSVRFNNTHICGLEGTPLGSWNSVVTSDNTIEFLMINSIEKFYQLMDALKDFNFPELLPTAIRNGSQYIADVYATTGLEQGEKIFPLKSGGELKVEIYGGLIFATISGASFPVNLRHPEVFFNKERTSFRLSTQEYNTDGIKDFFASFDAFINTQLNSVIGKTNEPVIYEATGKFETTGVEIVLTPRDKVSASVAKQVKEVIKTVDDTVAEAVQPVTIDFDNQGLITIKTNSILAAYVACEQLIEQTNKISNFAIIKVKELFDATGFNKKSLSVEYNFEVTGKNSANVKVPAGAQKSVTMIAHCLGFSLSSVDNGVLSFQGGNPSALHFNIHVLGKQLKTPELSTDKPDVVIQATKTLAKKAPKLDKVRLNPEAYSFTADGREIARAVKRKVKGVDSSGWDVSEFQSGISLTQYNSVVTLFNEFKAKYIAWFMENAASVQIPELDLGQFSTVKPDVKAAFNTLSVGLPSQDRDNSKTFESNGVIVKIFDKGVSFESVTPKGSVSNIETRLKAHGLKTSKRMVGDIVLKFSRGRNDYEMRINENRIMFKGVPQGVPHSASNFVNVPSSVANGTEAQNNLIRDGLRKLYTEEAPAARFSRFLASMSSLNETTNTDDRRKSQVTVDIDMTKQANVDLIKSILSPSGKMNESIKEDLTGVAPKRNKVDKKLFETTLRGLGFYQPTFSYGGAGFQLTLNEGVVDILPTYGNIVNLQKLLKARLGAEIVTDDRGGLTFCF